jgi:Serine incorporator (Serinc)
MSSLLNFGFSKATRVGHLLIVLSTFIFAIILGVHFPNEIRHYQDQLGLNPVQDCPWYADCRYDTYLQLIYRASFGLSLCFSLLAITTYFFEVVDKSMWLMKFGMAIGSFIGCCYFTNDVALNWAEVARYVSFLWLLVQGLIYLDFAHDVHDALMAFAEDTMRERGSANGTYGFYIFLSVGLLVCCGMGFGRLFIIAQHNKEDMYFAVITLVTGVLFTGISILNTVKKGLLTPCIVFTYSVFLNLSASCLTLPENVSIKVHLLIFMLC